MAKLFGASASAIKNDTEQTPEGRQQSQDNQKLIEAKCLKKSEIIIIVLLITLCGYNILAVGQGQKHDEPKLRTLTVCQALSHAAEYSGKMVRIRGKIGSTNEGSS